MVVLLAVVAAFADDPAPVSAPEAVPAAPAAPPPAVEDDAEVATALAALRADIAAQRAALARQELELRKLRQKDLVFDLDGYFRTRAFQYGHLLASQGTGDDYRDARFLQMRTRLLPSVVYKNAAKFYVQVDALDDVVMGDNQGLSQTALFSFGPGTTDFSGATMPSVAVSRAWAELSLPAATMRVGRMPNNWGMGILANGGDGFDNLFGEKHGQSTADRVLVATRPLSVVAALRGKPDPQIPLIVAVGVDRIVEDPLTQYYGFECERGVAEADDDYDARCDTNADGLTDVEHGFIEDRSPEDRNDEWWVDQNDDVGQMIFVVVYRGEDVKYLGAVGDLTAGTQVVHRWQKETDSDVWITDLYLKAVNRFVRFEAEAVNIRGTTRAIALPGAYDPTGASDDPLLKTADMWGYAARGGVEYGPVTAMVETGYASGDANVADKDFRGRPLNAEYNVGLLLYEEVLRRVTAYNWGSTKGLYSNGGVYNSRYLQPYVIYEPLERWQLVGSFLAVWPDQPDGSNIRCRTVEEGCAQARATKALIGTEVDVAIKHRWMDDHLLWSLEGGAAWATDRLPLEAAGLNPDGKFLTVQSRIAYSF